MKYLSILLAALAGVLDAQSAHAVDVRATTVRVSDAETGVSTKFAMGRKLAIRCDYEYVGSASWPPWQVQLQMDGVTVGTYAAEVPPPSFNPNPLSPPTIKKFSVDAPVTPKTVGEHKATCLLDPGGKLKGLDSNPSNNSSSTSFVVDVVPRATTPAQPGPVAATPGGLSAPKGGSGPGGPGAQAQAPTPVLLEPALELKLKAQPLANCGSGQNVVAVTGTLNNVGQGIAVIPSGKQVIKIEVDAGVNGGSISSTGNLAPGQSLPVSANLKAKGAPSNLAGATLKLNAQVVASIKQSATWGNQQILTVAFPANFCKSPTVLGGENLRPAPSRAAPK